MGIFPGIWINFLWNEIDLNKYGTYINILDRTTEGLPIFGEVSANFCA
jgi:hypothetical protein